MHPPVSSADASPAGTTDVDPVLGVVSLLHLPPRDPVVASRDVLGRTLGRLARVESVAAVAVLCWDDQADDVRRTPGADAAVVLPHGGRKPLPSLTASSAASRWSDGWRGGLRSAGPFDAGFFGVTTRAVVRSVKAASVLLVDPGSVLLDAALTDDLIDHARARATPGYAFTVVPPGLTGMLLRTDVLDRLVDAGRGPGGLLHYDPDWPQLDPVSGEGCLHVPQAVSQSLADFRWTDAARGRWLDTLAGTDAASLCRAASGDPEPGLREVVLDLTSRRRGRPVWLAADGGRDLPWERVETFLRGTAAGEPGRRLRLTLGGRGDPLLHPDWRRATALAGTLGMAVHVETDLLGDAAETADLATSGVEVVSVHLPGQTPPTYAAVAGVDGLGRATENTARLMAASQSAGLPLIVPTFVKTRHNVHELEGWYDQWLRACGSAVVRGPDFDGNVPPADPADPDTPVEAASMLRTERVLKALRLSAA